MLGFLEDPSAQLNIQPSEGWGGSQKQSGCIWSIALDTFRGQGPHGFSNMDVDKVQMSPLVRNQIISLDLYLKSERLTPRL